MPLHDDNLFTTFVGNLHASVTEELLYELFLQVGPLKKVCIPKNSVTGENKTFGFVTFSHEVSVSYAIDMLQAVPLSGQRLNLKKRHARKDTTENKEKSNDMNVLPVEAVTNTSPHIRNDTESLNSVKELVGRFATKVLPTNARAFNSEPMEIRASAPLHVKHFNATHPERKMRMDRDERSFHSSLVRAPKHLSCQSPYATPQLQIMENSSSSMLLNRSKSFGNYRSPIIPPQRVFHHGASMNDQRMPQKRPMNDQRMPQKRPMNDQRMPQRRPMNDQRMAQRRPVNDQRMPQKRPINDQGMPQRRPIILHCNQPVGSVDHGRNWNEQNVRREGWHTRHHPYKSRSFN